MKRKKKKPVPQVEPPVHPILIHTPASDLSHARKVLLACLGQSFMPDILALPEPDLERLRTAFVKSMPGYIDESAQFVFVDHSGKPFIRPFKEPERFVDPYTWVVEALMRAAEFDLSVPGDLIDRYDELLEELPSLKAAAAEQGISLHKYLESREDWRVARMMSLHTSLDDKDYEWSEATREVQERIRDTALNIYRKRAIPGAINAVYYQHACSWLELNEEEAGPFWNGRSV